MKSIRLVLRGMNGVILRVRSPLAALIPVALLGATASLGQTVTFEEAWSIGTDAGRAYVTSGTTERGVAINPVTGHVLVASRAGGVQVAILDGETGEELGELDMTGVSGGVFALSAIGVADDGAIYGANLVTSASGTAPFQIYRWADEAASPIVAYVDSPSDGMRFGDSLDVRGAGPQTQIVAGSSGTATDVRFVVFETADGENFDAVTFSPGGVAAGALQKGISFGDGNTVYGKTNPAASATHISFDLTDASSAVIGQVPIDGSVTALSVDSGRQILAGMNFSSHQLVIYDITNAESPVVLTTYSFPAPVTANGNGVGAVDITGDRIAAVDTQNGVIAVNISVTNETVPPEILTQPEDQAVLAGGTAVFTVGATGTQPLTYQWFFGDAAIPDATEATLTLASVTPDESGEYRVTVTNAAGDEMSEGAVLEVTPLVQSGRLTKLWSVGPSERDYLATDNAHRGMAYNPVSENVLLVSRTLGDTNVYVLNGATGEHLHRLNNTGPDGENFIFGGLFRLNMVAVADDGAVYACNLSTSGSDFIIYRWANDDPETVPTIAYGPGNPGIGRVGDTLDVRGSGDSTLILAGARSGNQVVTFFTFDGAFFDPDVYTIDAVPAGNIGLGLGFGEGNTIWGTAFRRPLYKIGFDPVGFTVAVDAEYGADVFSDVVSNIGSDPVNDLLAGIAIENPDNVRLYDVSDADNPPVLVHQELLASDNANLNGTGAVDFGGDRLYVLSTNNGIAAYQVNPPSAEPPVLAIRRDGNTVVLSWDGAFTLESAPDLNSEFSTVDGASSPHTVGVLDAQSSFWRLREF